MFYACLFLSGFMIFTNGQTPNDLNYKISYFLQDLTGAVDK